jgi:hypothetical protein
MFVGAYSVDLYSPNCYNIRIDSNKEPEVIKQFVQVSAHRDSNNFAHCSNLSLMADRDMSAMQALHYLQVMADDYAQRGYAVEWIRENWDAAYEEMYGDLFESRAVSN